MINKTSQKAGVVVVDDHPMVRERLTELISKEDDIFVCGHADNIREGLQVIRSSEPQAAIVDISLNGSSGLELVKELGAANLDVPVLILSMHDESIYAERALRAGAKGYITKHTESAKIITAIRKVLAGEIYLASSIADKIIGKLARGQLQRGLDRLTDRELEVFQLIGHGRTTNEIGIRLGLSGTTVETYRARIKEKLGLQNASQLSADAARWLVFSTHALGSVPA